MLDSNFEYFEDIKDLEITCPPENALIPDGTKEFYRVVKHNPATSNCFLPRKVLFTDMDNFDQCILKSLSTFDNIDGLVNAFFKTPAHKKKRKLIAACILQENDGKIQQTFSPGHYSWWRSKLFDPSSAKIQEVEV